MFIGTKRLPAGSMEEEESPRFFSRFVETAKPQRHYEACWSKPSYLKPLIFSVL